MIFQMGEQITFARCVLAVRERLPNAAVEVLTPDFLGNSAAIDRVTEVNPAVFNHNIETVPRLYRVARGRAEYARSLELLDRVKQRALPHIVWLKQD